MSARAGLRLLMAVVVGVLSAGQTRAGTPWAEVLTQQAVTAGVQATLPPHVSSVLGIATHGESVEVRQLVDRTGQKVRTFNVGVADHRVRVIFRVDEKSQEASAYLLTTRGRLRKAVSYHIGAEPHELTASEAQAGFTREVNYWLGRARERVPDATR